MNLSLLYSGFGIGFVGTLITWFADKRIGGLVIGLGFIVVLISIFYF